MGRLKIKLESLFQIGEGFLFVGALAGDVKLEALRNVLIAFAPDSRGEWSLHGNIISQGARHRLGTGHRRKSDTCRRYFHHPAIVSEGIFARIYCAISFNRSALLTGPV